MYHPRLKGTYYDMGIHYGKILFKTGQNFNSYIKLSKEQEEFGNNVLPIYEKYVPELVQEIRGLAEGSKTDFEKMSTWLFTMYGFGDIHGCTCFAFHDNQNIVLVRDSDMFPELKKTSESVLYMAKGKNYFLGNTTSFIQIEDGMNEFGLTIGINFLLTKEYKLGLNTGFVVRAILENCKTTEEAVSFIKLVPLCSTQNFIIADKSGSLAVVESSPNAIAVRYSHEYVISANHFVEKVMQNEHNNPDKNWYLTCNRYETVLQGMQHFPKDAEYAKELASGKHGFICQYDKKMNFDTLWSSVYDITGNKIWRAEGNPSKTSYKEDNRLQWGIKHKEK